MFESVINGSRCALLKDELSPGDAVLGPLARRRRLPAGNGVERAGAGSPVSILFFGPGRAAQGGILP
ncbi:hypothetical protein A9975_13205 [Cupriavidus sp. UME77]|nr:hypothetical protein [Cupriavidus sp. UME77]